MIDPHTVSLAFASAFYRRGNSMLRMVMVIVLAWALVWALAWVPELGLVWHWGSV